MRGWVHLQADGELEYEALVEDDLTLLRTPPQAPESLYLITPHASLLIPQVHPSGGGSHAFGGYRASVNRYFGTEAILGLAPQEMRSNRISRLSVRYNGIGERAGMMLSETELERGPDQRISTAKLTLSSVAPQKIDWGLPKLLSLTLDGHWQVDREVEGSRLVTTAVEVTLDSRAKPANAPSATPPSAGGLIWSSRLIHGHPRSVLAPEGADFRLTLAQLGGLGEPLLERLPGC